LGFGVWGLGFGVWDLGVGSWGLGVGGWGVPLWLLARGLVPLHLPRVCGREAVRQQVMSPDPRVRSGYEPDWL